MPIEIRELIIKTEISAAGRSDPTAVKENDLHSLKKQLLAECKKMISDTGKKNNYKR